MRKYKFSNIIILIILIIFIIMILAIISGGSTKDVPLENITNKIKQESSLNNMKEGDSKSLKRFYGLNSKDFADVAIYTPASTMDVNELLIIKMKDSSQADALEGAIESRVSKQLESFNGYGAEQCALLDDYVLKIKDNYIFYSVGDNAETMKKIFTQSIK